VQISGGWLLSRESQPSEGVSEMAFFYFIAGFLLGAVAMLAVIIALSKLGEAMDCGAHTVGSPVCTLQEKKQ